VNPIAETQKSRESGDCPRFSFSNWVHEQSLDMWNPAALSSFRFSESEYPSPGSTGGARRIV
jgi:hypothetical protein